MTMCPGWRHNCLFLYRASAFLGARGLTITLYAPTGKTRWDYTALEADFELYTASSCHVQR